MTWQLCENHNTPYSVFTGIIKQFDNDRRRLRLIRLHNGMQILVVHDAESPMAAATLTVRVGDLHDPEDLPGLAHFLEHLFRHGSERYPEEHAFTEYISKYRGRYGAWTSPEDTTYHIAAENHALDGLMDRFASLLSRPLFRDQSIYQEVCCIESEFQNYRLDDSWRLYDLDRHLSKAGNPWRRFGLGNWDTLARTAVRDTTGTFEEGRQEWTHDLRARLISWYSENYCASRMYMAIVGASPLEELTAMAVSHLSDVPRHLDTSFPVSPKFDSPWTVDQEGTVVLAKTVRDVRQIEVRWIVPTQTLFYRVKPLSFLMYFLHRRGSGSLYEVLTSRGWITSLHASQFGGDRERGFQSFYVLIQATISGWRAWEAVVATLHKYIALVQDLVVTDPELVSSIQKDLCSLSEIRFRFRESSGPVDEATLLSGTLSKSLPPADLITGVHITQDCDASLIADVLASLTPDKARVMLSGQDWDGMTLVGESISGDGPWDQAPWYKTEYKVLRLVHTTFTADDTAAEGLRLRRPEWYVPENLQVLGGKVEGIEPVSQPRKIHDTPQAELWYKMDDRFGVPKTSVIIRLITTLAGATPRHSLYTKILHKLINDLLADDFFDAAFALLDCHCHCQIDGMIIMVYGFSAKVPHLVKTILDKVVNFLITPNGLNIALEKVRQSLKNTTLDAPLDAATERLDYLLAEYGWTTAEMLAEVDSVSLSSIQSHLVSLLDRVHIRALVSGNVEEETAMSILNSVQDTLRCTPISAMERMAMLRRSLLLPESCNFVHEVPVPTLEEANSGLAFHCQIGDEMSLSLRTKFAVLLAIIGRPMFNNLQVTEQLGYSVSVQQYCYARTLGFRVLIQGTHDPAHVEQRVEACLEQMVPHIQELNEDDFENTKTLYMKRLRRGPTDIQNEAYRFWDRITSGYYDFTRREMEAQAVQCITKEEILVFFNQYIRPESPTRSKLSVRFTSANHSRPRDDSLTTSGVLVEHPLDFKFSLFPSRHPVRVSSSTSGEL